jgi:hypothetical protein
MVMREDGNTGMVTREDNDAVTREDGGPKRRAFGPRYVLFLFSLLYLLKYINIEITHHHYDTTTTHRPHPRSKRESVGFFLSLYGPTLAANASRWGLFTLFTFITAHPRYKRESVGRFHASSDTWTPTLTSNVSCGGLFLLYSYSK